MEQKKNSFLAKLTRIEIISILSLLLIIPAIKLIYRMLYLFPLSPSAVGILAPIVLNTIGSSIGVATISKSTSGGSVKSPALVMKSILGIVLCEANFIFSILSFFFLKERALEIEAKLGGANEIPLEIVQASWCILASGLICGICGMVSSMGSSVVNSASSISIASNSKMFSKLISLQLIIGGVGIFGTAISFFFLKLPSSLG
ncbi:V-type H+-transporting ATPase 21kDa proteolipid subunit [Nematocida ausubeli]|nr:V-type H+-transporting ATPase 21kDa proteolipid subunit [Nematocida ausubeli]KAI5161435.1 V-type H+-transporting ATPase 21kDa proteolipid subunit [Nematocida ausubeli]